MVALSNELTDIGHGSFWGCTALTAIDIPHSVTTIGDFAFSRCSGLPQVKIPNSVTSIGDGAFSYCTGLSTVVIGSGVTNIGFLAFEECPSLTDVYCYAEQIPETNSPYTFEDSNYRNATLHVPAASIDAYSSAEPWKDFDSIVALTDSDPNPTGLSLITRKNSRRSSTIYNLSGQKVDASYHGIIIKNGMKVMQ